MEGRLVTRVREAAQDQYVVVSQGHVFSAIYRHPERGLDLPVSPMQNLRPGSRVRVTGICVLDRGDQFRGPVAFHLLLRSSQDVALLAGPSLISVRNLGILLAILLIVIFAVIGRAMLLERRLYRQSVANSAAVDRWRTRIIDGINNALPLPDTLLQITELVSFKLQAEYSWAEVEFEGTFGDCPPASERPGLQITEQVIPGRAGAPLGKLCVAFPITLRRRISPDELENAVRVAALAIETGGRYSDLVRRSELDSLTEVHNRFAFERALDSAIEDGKTSAARFGLIYIDLDGFKAVNDQFGHNIGDRYLQEATSRLRHQLRPEDMLARIGGDEFAFLVASRTGAEETPRNRRETSKLLRLAILTRPARDQRIGQYGYCGLSRRCNQPGRPFRVRRRQNVWRETRKKKGPRSFPGLCLITPALSRVGIRSLLLRSRNSR